MNFDKPDYTTVLTQLLERQVPGCHLIAGPDGCLVYIEVRDIVQVQKVMPYNWSQFLSWAESIGIYAPHAVRRYNPAQGAARTVTQLSCRVLLPADNGPIRWNRTIRWNDITRWSQCYVFRLWDNDFKQWPAALASMSQHSGLIQSIGSGCHKAYASAANAAPIEAVELPDLDLDVSFG